MYDPENILNVIYQNGEDKLHYVKRFKIETNTVDKKFLFISESKGSKLIVATSQKSPIIKYSVSDGKPKSVPKEMPELNLSEFIDIKGWKSVGNRLNLQSIFSLELVPELILESKTTEDLKSSEEYFTTGDSIELEKTIKKSDEIQLNLF